MVRYQALQTEGTELKRQLYELTKTTSLEHFQKTPTATTNNEGNKNRKLKYNVTLHCHTAKKTFGKKLVPRFETAIVAD